MLDAEEVGIDQLVNQMTNEGWIHNRKGTNLATVEMDTILKHLEEEVCELRDAIALNEPVARKRDELGDILGCVVHLAARLHITMFDLERLAVKKLLQRFDPPGGRHA